MEATGHSRDVVLAAASGEPYGQEDETLRRAVALLRALRDPALPDIVFLACVSLGGVAALVWTVLKALALPYVPLQMPFVVWWDRRELLPLLLYAAASRRVAEEGNPDADELRKP